MASIVTAPTSVKLFYSYAHRDEALCVELQKHLTALKRAGLISDWYDGKIEPGSEWAAEIRQAMETAGIILLLISSDFLASKYIFETELPLALSRHDAGVAKVIPILLRPVEWHDLPFARLQVLPSHARPVTSWPDQDQAFSDVAGKLRELLYAERLKHAQTSAPPAALFFSTQQRVLDAAIASSVVIDEPTDVVALIRMPNSGGLKAILRLDRTYSATDQDVKSKTVELEFPRDAAGKLLPARLGIQLECPGFNPPNASKQVRVPANGDSDIIVIMLTPTKAGILRVNFQVLLDDVVIASNLLSTRSVPASAAEPVLSYGVVTMPIYSSPGGAEFTRMLGGAQPTAPMAFPVQAAVFNESFGPQQHSEPKAFPTQAAASPASELPPAPPIRTQQSRRSNTKWWIGLGSSAAAIALISSTLWMPRSDSTATIESGPHNTAQQPVTAASVESKITALTKQAKVIELEQPKVKTDPELSLIHKRIQSNLEKADKARHEKQYAAAQKYLSDAQRDLATLKKQKAGEVAAHP